MSKAQLIKNSDIVFSHRGGPPGRAEVGRAISTNISSSMGAGFAKFDDCSIEWTVLYDEIVYVISGTFCLVVEGESLIGEAGDVLWIPKGTELKYQGQQATVFYAVYPGNWKEILQSA
jgi:ethanolamine utilization protein EutQ